MNRPDVFTLLMAWEEQVSGEEVKATLDVIEAEVRFRESGTDAVVGGVCATLHLTWM